MRRPPCASSDPGRGGSGQPTRITIGGSSAGAITAVNVGYASHSGPASGVHQTVSSAVEAVQSLSGCAITTVPGPGGTAALFFHGTADPLVPYACATATVAAAREGRARCLPRHLARPGSRPLPAEPQADPPDDDRLLLQRDGPGARRVVAHARCPLSARYVDGVVMWHTCEKYCSMWSDAAFTFAEESCETAEKSSLVKS